MVRRLSATTGSATDGDGLERSAVSTGAACSMVAVLMGSSG